MKAIALNGKPSFTGTLRIRARIALCHIVVNCKTVKSTMLTINVHVADLHVHAHGLDAPQMAEIKRSFTNLRGQLMASKEELTATLAAQADQAEKVKAEVIAAVAALGNTATTPEQDALLARISAALGGLDELNPDAVPVEPPA